MHTKNIFTAGAALSPGGKALVMIHGRGAGAADILSLSSHLAVAGFTLLAPQATNNSWYPFSFLAPPAQNEPWLSSALAILKELVGDITAKNIPEKNIYFAGFSQGACLTLEFVARNARRYGGVAAFTGGLIGDTIHPENYSGDFNETPVFIGSGDPDSHVPVERVHATTALLQGMNAIVKEKIYPGLGHTINQDEIERTNKFIFNTGIGLKKH